MRALSPDELERTAKAYDALLVPGLFQGWADRMAELAGLDADDDVLDVACGTGVLSMATHRYARSVTGLDVNPGMLAVAREKAPRIAWRQGNAETLPFEDASFDVVVSQFGLMLFEAREQAVREMWRVLRPGGRLYVAVFDALGNNPAYGKAADGYEQVVGSAIGNALRYPFSMGDSEELSGVFEEAGVSDPVVTTHGSEARFDSVRHMVLSDVKGWFPFAGFHLDDATIERVEKKLAGALEAYVQPDGDLRFSVSVHVVEASKPRSTD